MTKYRKTGKVAIGGGGGGGDTIVARRCGHICGEQSPGVCMPYTLPVKRPHAKGTSTPPPSHGVTPA